MSYGSVGVIIGTHLRLDILPELLAAIQRQTVRPAVIRIVHDGPLPPPKVDVPVIAASHNLGVYLRFFVAMELETEYVAIFDDDTIPGPRWLENCLLTCRQVGGPVGARGVIYLTDERDMVDFGWPNPSEEAVEVDVLGHCWFLLREWLSWYVKEPRCPGITTAGEDYHLSYVIQKYLGTGVWAAPHPPNDRDWWGSLRGMELGNDSRALWRKPEEREKRFKVHEYYLSKGWQTLKHPKNARRKRILLGGSLPPRRPRVTCALPQLVCGGAEQSTFAIAKNLVPQLVDFQGVANLEPAHWPPLKQNWLKIGQVAETPEAVSKLLSHTDILINSGIWNTWKVPKRIFVSHGIGAWTKSKSVLAELDPNASLVAVSKMAAQVYEKDMRKVTVIYNGVDLDRLQPVISRGIVRNFWGIKEEEIAVGYIGRIVEGKGIVEMAAAVRQLGPPFKAVVVGPCWNLKFRQKILEANPDTIFIPPQDHLGDVYAALDCTVCFSESEGFGMSIVESWACGVPTVVSPVGVVPELQEAYGQLTLIATTAAELPNMIRNAVNPKHRPIAEKAKEIALRYLTAQVAGKRWSEYLFRLWQTI